MKKILSILLVCIFVLSMSLCVYADENVSEDEIYVYNIEALVSSNNVSGNELYGWYGQGELILKNKQLVFYTKSYSGQVYLCTYVYNGNSVIHHQSDYIFQNVGGYIDSNNVNVTMGEFRYNGDKNYQLLNSTGSYSYLWCDMLWNSNPIEKSGFIDTNIPIFESQQEALGYINGEIGIESALNYSSNLLTTITDSDEVPLPKNLRIEYDSTNYNYYLMWEYEPKDLEKLTVIAVTGIDKDLFVSPKNRDDYKRYPTEIEFDVSLDEYLDPRLSYKLDITNDVVRLRRTIDEENDFSLADYRVTLDYWVIGSWQKNSTEFHTSKISHVELILDSSDKGFKIDTDNYITDKDMNVLDDVEFDTSIDFETNNSSSGFMGNLVGAFGLLGNNGFLACCKAVFGCFPAFVWDLLGAGLSAAIIIVLIKILFS